MLIQINTDKNIEGHQRLEEYFTEQLQNSLKKYEDRITRLEVHLSDENSTKGGGNDKKCTIEARAAGLKPVGVASQADTIEKAIVEATNKIKSALESTFGKINAY
ncbi:MAG: ribosomal subunit interface protein [Flavobacterium sp. MedPE-SWcel]|uniref:HPF/RaiA family ribosome-associated protein n=1 Tax=uncultured Flavobacterium sp. TaxID=165435 RepID=UPI000910CEEC|nr:HPF/RaiA family ribosome-associated protein [uncultured Flavobacterium sp.]OIQ21664.1 MAG: ribosomal subunit interface protein [Flavobacterium sp. MedPE-SWcel]